MPASRTASSPPPFASVNRCPPPILAQGRARLRSAPRWSRKTRPQQGRQRQCPHHRRHRGTCSRGRNMSEHGSPKTEKTDEARARKSVVEGKSVSVRVSLGGRGIIKKKKKYTQSTR